MIKNRSTKQMINFKHNNNLKRVYLEFKLEDSFQRALNEQNIELNFNFLPIHLEPNQYID